MNDARVGRIVRAVRLDRRFSQAALGRPAGSREARAWIAEPRGDLAGLWFVSPVAVAHKKTRCRRPGDGR